MNAQQQIDQQLNDEYNKFYETKYDGKPYVPEEFIELFKKSIISVPPFAHKINFHKIKSISQKKVEMLTFGDLHEMIKVILNTPLGKLYPEMDESNKTFVSVVEKYIKIEKFVIEYNAQVEDFQGKLKMKKQTLQSLAGTSHRNGSMSIIN